MRYIRNATEFSKQVTLGVTSESMFLEFKKKIGHKALSGPPKDELKREIARDIAQMANAMGGTIVVGVKEGPGSGAYGTAKSYCSVDDVGDFCSWINSAVRENLSPRDLSFETIPTKLLTGEDILLIVIPPFERGVVAVWDRGKKNCIEYPIRTSVGKDYLSPFEVESRLMDRTRAIEIRLQKLIDETTDCIVCSEVKVPGRETDLEQNERLNNIRLHTTAIPRGQEGHLSVLRSRSNLDMSVVICSENELSMSMKVMGKERVFHVPYGIIREVWMTHRKKIGLIFEAPLIVPEEDGEPWFDYHNIQR